MPLVGADLGLSFSRKISYRLPDYCIVLARESRRLNLGPVWPSACCVIASGHDDCELTTISEILVFRPDLAQDRHASVPSRSLVMASCDVDPLASIIWRSAMPDQLDRTSVEELAATELPLAMKQDMAINLSKINSPPVHIGCPNPNGARTRPLDLCPRPVSSN